MQILGRTHKTCRIIVWLTDWRWHVKDKQELASIPSQYICTSIFTFLKLQVKTVNAIPAPLAGGKVSRKARTVNALINTLFLVCKNSVEELFHWWTYATNYHEIKCTFQHTPSFKHLFVLVALHRPTKQIVSLINSRKEWQKTTICF
jgi:hypothetical protein